jgi:glycerol-3-phosphate O-acyltransferase
LLYDGAVPAAMFRFNQMRPEIVDEVTRRVGAARRADAAAHPDESLAYQLNDVVIHELRRLRRVQPPDTVEDRRRIEAVAQALQRGASQEELGALLDTLVRAYAEDIAGSFSLPAYRVASRLLPSALSLAFTPLGLRHLSIGLGGGGALEERIRIDGDLDQLRRLAESGVLIVVPTHLSNLDSPLVGFALERAGLPPMTYGAGKNLFSSPLTAFFMARLGAYKVDRRLRFGLYKEVLKTFSQVILERGLHSIFFPGGTRSRSGAIERKLKLGLAGTALSAYIEELRTRGPTAPRYYFVPLTLNMPLVLEAETLIEDYLKEVGKNRYIIEDDEFTRIGRVLTFVRKLLTMDSAIEVRFCSPRDPFGNRVDAAGRSHDLRGREVDPARYVLVDGAPAHHRGRDEEYTRELGALVADDYLAGASYFSTHLVALVLFVHMERELPGLDLYRRLRHPRELTLPLDELARRVERVRDAVEANVGRGLGRLAARAHGLDGAALVHDALVAFSGYHTRPAVERRGAEVALVERELIYYYHNRLAHHAPAHEALA